MNREGAPGKSPEEMYIQQKVRVLLMLRKMGSNVSACRVSSIWVPAALKEGRDSRGQFRLPLHRALHVQCWGGIAKRESFYFIVDFQPGTMGILTFLSDPQ